MRPSSAGVRRTRRHLWWVVLGLAVVAVVVVDHAGGRSILRLAGSGPVAGTDSGLTEVTLRSLTVAGAGTATTAVVGEGGSVVLQSGYEVRSVAGTTPRITADLEQRDGQGAWLPAGRSVTILSGAPLMIRTPPRTTARTALTVQYRLTVGGSASTAVGIRYENPAAYRGMAAVIARYAAPYCPHTAVHVADLRGSEAGVYTTGALLILVDSSVGVTADLKPVDQRALAVHECSHELQWVNYGGTPAGRARMQADAARLFTVGSNGAPPLEHAADCGARSVDPAGYLGYGGYCTPTELAEGRRLLAGHRY